jgi:hypothetical protein
MSDIEAYSHPSIHEKLLDELFRLRDDENAETYYAEDGAIEQRLKHILDGVIYSMHYTSTAEYPDSPTIRLHTRNDEAASQIMIIDQDIQLSIINFPASLRREPVNDKAQLELLQQLRQLGQETQIATVGTLQELADTITKNCEKQQLIFDDTQSKQTQYRKPLEQTPNSPSLFSLEKIEELEVDKKILLGLTAYRKDPDSVESYTLLSYTTTPGEFATEYRYTQQVEAHSESGPSQIYDLFMEQDVQQLLDLISNSKVIDTSEVNIEPR